MGTQTPPSDQNDREEATHRDDVLNDLTIIQAQAQLMMRRIDAKHSIDHDDVYQRLAGVVEAVQRLARMHRSS